MCIVKKSLTNEYDCFGEGNRYEEFYVDLQNEN
jgi:hypothetical protein